MQRQSLAERRSRPRQEPVSCQSCRAKKLRCNRQQPCSNCLARGITCLNESRLLPALDGRSLQEPTTSTSTSTSSDGDGAAILTRLKRLEDLLLGFKGTQVPSPQSDSLRSRSVTPSIRSKGDEISRIDSAFLEDVGIRTDSLVSGLSDRILWGITTIQDALALTRSLTEEQTGSLSGSQNRIWLPTQEEAVSLFENYLRDVDCLQHVISAHSVRAILDEVYMYVVERRPVKSSHVALLLSIFASTAYYWTPRSDRNGLFLTFEDANQASLLWSKGVLDVLEHSRRTTAGSVEDIQATIILSFLVFNLEGLSARSRSLISTALVTARNLGLHKLDVQHQERLGSTLDTCLEIEVKRRIWWHIVATDWILSFTGGPQEGMYFIQPRHMTVRYPRNLDDDDLMSVDFHFERPLSEPTSMSYFLQRIRLAEICRMVVDSMPMTTSDPAQANYQNVISLDNKFETFLMEVPVFLRLDEDSRRKSGAIDQKFPQIEIQRYLLNLAVYNRRCKLHRPFLVQFSHEPRYLYSRDMCLRCARAIFQVRRLLENGNSFFASAHLRLCAVVYYVFMATVVLVMELCFNKIASLEEEQQRKQEVADACQMLKEAEGQSAIAGRLLESLMDVLRKHKIRLLNLDADRPSNGSGCTAAGTGHISAGVVDHVSRFGEARYHEPAEHDGSLWNTSNNKQLLSDDAGSGNIWQDFIEPGLDSGEVDWDHLFADLDSRAA